MSLRDRGIIKWQGLILPEHKKLVNGYFERDNHVKKPLLDEDEIEVLERVLNGAYVFSNDVAIEYWRDGYTHQTTGQIEGFDSVKRSVKMEDGTSLSFDDIINAYEV